MPDRFTHDGRKLTTTNAEQLFQPGEEIYYHSPRGNHLYATVTTNEGFGGEVIYPDGTWTRWHWDTVPPVRRVEVAEEEVVTVTYPGGKVTLEEWQRIKDLEATVKRQSEVIQQMRQDLADAADKVYIW